MTSGTAILNTATRFMTEDKLAACLRDELAKAQAVRIEGDSIIFNPKYMKLNRFYFVELKGAPYLYRKIGEHEVEIYGLA